MTRNSIRVQNAPQDGENYILGNFEKVYDQLFGEFVNGVASRYIDACNDGAYWYEINIKTIVCILIKQKET